MLQASFSPQVKQHTLFLNVGHQANLYRFMQFQYGHPIVSMLKFETLIEMDHESVFWSNKNKRYKVILSPILRAEAWQWLIFFEQNAASLLNTGM